MMENDKHRPVLARIGVNAQCAASFAVILHISKKASFCNKKVGFFLRRKILQFFRGK